MSSDLATDQPDRSRSPSTLLASYIVKFYERADGRFEVAVRNTLPPQDASVPHEARFKGATQAEVLLALPQLIVDMEAMRNL